MSCLHNAKESFYEKLSKIDVERKIDNLHIDKEFGFFELCKIYADIGLNADKTICEEAQSVKGLFNHNDIERAKRATLVYIKDNNIENVELLMEMIKVMHKHAVEWDDSRKKGGVVRVDSRALSSGYMGSLYSFSKLPSDIFDKIYSDIIQLIS